MDLLKIDGTSSSQVLTEDGECVVCREWCLQPDGKRGTVLAVRPTSEHPASVTLDRLAHEYSLREELNDRWALRPVGLVEDRGQITLVLEDPGGEPLDRLLDAPIETAPFLQLAIGIVAALGEVHKHGLIHKDLKPAHILVNQASGRIWLTGFGIASRLPSERQAPEPPETIAGTLAYMAPEQTGRMNRSVDARSDLYAVGVTLYQMLTGVLPFAAAEPMEWVHCHIARQPVPPADRLASVPEPVSTIVMKLLAKTAEERYQTAAGVERDLQHCLAEWNRQGRIDKFAPGQQDTPDRLLIPEKLYGREREIAALLAAFDRTVEGGAPEIVLVSGYSGIGKSSVVNELHKVLVPPRGLFAAGKFDQYRRDIPYATLAQAFQDLVRPLLGKSDAELLPWRAALREALGSNGQLMVDLVPSLAALIGPQQPVSELPPHDAQRRFQLVFRRMLSVFARPEHPLALFLDDLQWLDIATLDLLEHLATQPELRNLLLVGAYRDNEVTPSHPLARRLAAIRSAGGRVQEIVLSPLRLADVQSLISDALHCGPECTTLLARLVQEKAAGNPFFTIQFFTALAEEGLLAFDHGKGQWSWNLERIRAKGYTDNVVDLMLGKLRRLPTATEHALRLLACLGSSASISTLALVGGESDEAPHNALWPAAQAGLVVHAQGRYRFAHDRIQEAAYGLTPMDQRAAEHLRIGRLLAAHTPAQAIDEQVFEIVGQLNRGAGLLTSVDEREQAAALNLLAGKRARAATAYTSALNYFVAGAALLSEDGWQRRRDLAFPLALNRAECEFLTGALADAENHLTALSRRAADLLELAAVTCLQEQIYTTLDRSDRSIEVALDYLRRVGVTWSAHPTQDEVRREHERMWQQIGERPIEALIDLPRMTDPVWRATMVVLTEVVSAATYTDENLSCVVLGRMANLSLEHGNTDASSSSYAHLGAVLGGLFGDYKAGFSFGQLSFNLVTKLGLDRFKARVYIVFGHQILPWTKPIRISRNLIRLALDAAHETGDLIYGAYARTHMVTHLLASGDPLDEVQREAVAALDFARQARFGLVVDRVTGQLQLLRTLRGMTPVFGRFDDAAFDEAPFEQHLQADERLALAACWYWIRKLQARVLAGDHAAAFAAAVQADRLLWTIPFYFERAEYHFYAALARAALCDTSDDAQRTLHWQALAAHHQQLQVWADHCPENFANRAALVGAEVARVDGRERDAMNLYEQAIRTARDNGFIQNEAIANELAARFYAGMGFETISQTYLRNARYGYLRWGAEGKVRQLDELHPQLREKAPVAGSTSTIGETVEHLDLATVMKVSQAVSGEIVAEKLIETLMRTAIEQAGAQRGLLIIPRGPEPRIEAQAVTGGETVVVQLSDLPVTAAMLPEIVLHYVLRTHESVILDDAAAQFPFATDPYIRERDARSILCLPLIAQAKLIGVLYLENNLARRVFAPARCAVLKLLASQAAVALEVARLYRDLEQREAKIRRLVDANIIGIFIWDFAGRIFEANEAFLQMLGYSRDDLASDRVRWTTLTPSEWARVDEKAVAELRATGSCKPYEKEYIRKDGGRVPVLVGAATFGELSDQGVAFLLDLTRRKQAEAEARESERRYREAQMEVAHANRVATMGQLTASIAHEVNQPIAATATHAEAALRWLARRPPQLDEVEQALTHIVRNSHRARDVIGRIRELIAKAPARKDWVDINEAIREVIEFTHGEAVKNGASVKMALGASLPLVHADRVQLQQVVLNLVLNAVQAMCTVVEGQRELLISTDRAEPDGVRVEVKDSGPGFPSESLEHLFAPFYTTKPGGLGVGLSICRSIIEAHGGLLWVSVNVPQGTIFCFTLPTRPYSP
ncbi:trifunctional serine/threonine-protein kinase/ATP-binding protein/sensor histidine kinase [Paraburkholderia humisilvae]|uniref:histidine kinase n=1 Tax=Paraburkholderia humisilvae TaxID=627669 RepID=A0A6J5D4G3_9BURK|nr:trifunctional serine/threonine-protein kinase/ATP-binding protein/sensor histidine kinase [Paraburkholderia humisilvae]CAB3749088.1 Adaptive-response sensory-kinase SasA [Paraburkholderia humisilvae]